MQTAHIEPDERLGFDRRMSREEINALPIRSFNGPIEIIRTTGELDRALSWLEKEQVLGFDTETRPNFKKGQNNPTSLLQLAGETTACLFQLQHLGFPKKLRRLLANPAIIKAGVAVDQDLIQLRRLGPFTDEGFIELTRAAKNAGIKNHGLRGLAAVLLGFRISKGAQRSNWARPELSEKQLRYAATDAWVGREIYLRMQEMNVIYPDILLDG